MARRTVSTSSYVILEAIAAGHRHGFDIIDVSGLPSGTVYPALRRFEAQGMVRAKWESAKSAHREGRPARRYYELTATGEKVLADARQRYQGLSRLAASPDPGSATI